MTEDRFIECVKAHRQRSSFFPLPHDLIEISREMDNRPKKFVALPPLKSSAEEIAAIKKMVKDLKAKYSGPAWGWKGKVN